MKLIKIALLSCLITANLNANTTNSETENNGGPTCDEVLQACDNAVNALEAEVLVLKDLNQIRKDEITRLRDNEDSWARNKWLWVGAGLIVGLAGGVYLTK